MLLVSWNVAGRRTRLQEQAERVLGLEPDLVCLQEITPVTAEPWLTRLAEAGLTAALAPLPPAREGSRPLAVLTAARAGPLEIVNVHSPISPKPGLAKVLKTWEWPRWGGGYRLDHLIASAEVEVAECAYRHDWRHEDRLSDHSALVAQIHVGAQVPR